MATTRRIRWYPPPLPSPRILHLPLGRPIRRKTTSKNHLNPKTVVPKETSELLSHQNSHPRGKLETLFDQERVFSKTVPIVLLNSSSSSVGHHFSGDGNGRRERVEEDLEFGDKCEEPEEDINKNEKWRFQAEILRAESLIKLEINRVQIQKTFRSAGKKKIYQGKNVDSVLEEEVDELEEKLNDLHRKSGVTDINKTLSQTEFINVTSVLQRRLKKLEFDDKYVKEIQQMDESSITIKPNSNNHRVTDVRISKGMLEKMEAEYRSMLSSTTTSSTTSSGTSSASTSSRYEFSHNSFSSFKKDYQHHQRQEPEEKVCSGRCKTIVRKIVEQVRSEMEQWSQMQVILGRVRVEMEELQASRDYWEDRALNSNNQVQSLESSVRDWREKAQVNETKVSELQIQIPELQLKTKNLEMTQGDLSQKEKEKRVLICSLKENPKANLSKQSIKYQYTDIGRTKECPTHSGNTGSNRSPLCEIKNSSSLMSRQIGRNTFLSPSYSTEKHHRANYSMQNRDNFGIGRKEDGAYHNGSTRTPLEEVGNLALPKFRQKRRESSSFVLV
ncbi:hypothetical protein MKX01_039073 [Papaver californicum]|nr:hypothetical protein MKX01_039073 [Papaver californicum]